MNTQSEDKFLLQVKQSLDASVAQVDGDTRQRLRDARQYALARAHGQTMFVRMGSSLAGFLGLHPSIRTVALAASVTLAVLATWQITRSDAGPRVTDEVMLLSAQDDLELYDQLDFLEWLNTRDASKG